MSVPIGGPFERSLYLQPFSRYCALSVLGTSLIFQGHMTSSVTRPFDSPYVISYWKFVVWNQASICNGFRDIQRWK